MQHRPLVPLPAAEEAVDALSQIPECTKMVAVAAVREEEVVEEEEVLVEAAGAGAVVAIDFAA